MQLDNLEERIRIQERKSERSWEYITAECHCPDSLHNFRATVAERDVESLEQAVFSIAMAIAEHHEDVRHDSNHIVEPTIQVGFEPITFEAP